MLLRGEWQLFFLLRVLPNHVEAAFQYIQVHKARGAFFLYIIHVTIFSQIKRRSYSSVGL